MCQLAELDLNESFTPKFGAVEFEISVSEHHFVIIGEQLQMLSKPPKFYPVLSRLWCWLISLDICGPLIVLPGYDRCIAAQGHRDFRLAGAILERDLEFWRPRISVSRFTLRWYAVREELGIGNLVNVHDPGGRQIELSASFHDWLPGQRLLLRLYVLPSNQRESRHLDFPP